MTNLAAAASERKPQPDARALISAQPWALLRQLPTHLADLSPDVRDLVGKAVDGGIARLVLDQDGRAVVRRARP
jgi:hypothetical protein